MKISARIDARFHSARGLAPLKIAIAHKGQTAYIPLDIQILPSQWDHRTQQVIAHPNKYALNLLIGQRLLECRQRALEYMQSRGGSPVTAQMIRDAVKADPQEVRALTVLYEKYLNTKRGNTRLSYEQTYRKLCQYIGPSDISVDDITVGWLEDWDSWLQRQGLSVNGRAVHHRNFRALLNYAVDHEITTNYPYRRYRIRTAPTAHRDISAEEFRAFVTYPCEPWQRKYQAVFLLSFCLAGMNVKDLFLLKESDYAGGRITYRRAKTDKQYDLAVHPIAADLIAELRSTNVNNPYLLNIADTYSDYRSYAKHFNHALKKIGNPPLQPHITTYTARHTFASIAANIGISRDMVGQLLGHSTTVTDIYIRYDRRAADLALARTIDAALGR